MLFDILKRSGLNEQCIYIAVVVKNVGPAACSWLAMVWQYGEAIKVSASTL